MKRWLVALILVMAFVGAARAWFLRWSEYMSQGIDNLELFKVYGDRLAEFRQKTRRYPDSLGEIGQGFQFHGIKFGEDRWGHPLMYESRGSGYVLVSFGRDGKPDGLDPWRLRDLNVQDEKQRRTCGHLDADQIMSDRGFHRACFK